MVNWNNSYLVEFEDIDTVQQIIYIEFLGSGIVILLSVIGCVLCIWRLCEVRDKETTQLTLIVLLLWMCLLVGSGIPVIIAMLSLVSDTLVGNPTLCLRLFKVSTLMYTTSHVVFYGVLLHRAQASRSLVRGDKFYSLLFKTILMMTLGAPIVTTIVALVLAKGVLLRDSSGRVVCRAMVVPSASILVAVLDSVLSMGYLLLFIIPLRKAIAPMVEANENPDVKLGSLQSVQKQVETKLRTCSNIGLAAARQELVEITKRNLLLSAIQIVGTFVCMLAITVSSLLPIPQVGVSTEVNQLNKSASYSYTFALLDSIIMYVVQCNLTTAWVPRRVISWKTRVSIYPSRLATGNMRLSSRKAVESSTGGLSEF